MLLYFLMLMMFLICVSVLVWPLLGPVRSGAASDRDEWDVRMAENVAIYRRGLAEIARDYAQGQVAPEDYDRLAAELKCNLLDARQGAGAQAVRRSPQPRLALMVTLIAFVASFAGYRLLAPVAALDQWYTTLTKFGPVTAQVLQGKKQLSEASADATLRDFVQVAQYLLQTRADVAQGWSFFSDLMQEVGAGDQALVAARKAYMLEPANLDAVMRYVQLELSSNAGKMTPRAQAILAKANALSPSNPSILLVQATAYGNSGQWAQAAQAWEQLLGVLGSVELGSPLHQQALNAVEKNLAYAQRQMNGSKEGLEDEPKKGDAVEGARIRVSVTGTAALLETAPEGAQLFVVAKASAGAGPPLAVKRLRPERWPVEVVLTERDAMVTGLSLAGRSEAVISAWWSFDGAIGSGPTPGALVQKVESGGVDPRKNPLVTLQLPALMQP